MPTLLVASTGGHLAQLHQLWPRLRAGGLDEPALWVTFDTPQSRSLLRDERAVYLRYVAPRDYRNVMRNMTRAQRILRSDRWTGVVSTGSGIALSVLPLARAQGIPCHYIESAARSAGPSLTGRVMRALPGISTYSQYEAWADEHWRYAGSIFDDFRPNGTVEREVRTVLVTLGTIPFGFERLVRRVEEIAPPGVRVRWQTGTTAVAPDLDAVPTMPQRELADAVAGADAVIAHAGIGSALTALQAGKAPVLVVREQAHAEHIDDHQEQIARDLDRRGLALGRRVSELRWEDVERAARIGVTRSREVTAFPLRQA